MLKYGLTVEVAFYIAKQNGVIIYPSLSVDFHQQLQEKGNTGIVVASRREPPGSAYRVRRRFVQGVNLDDTRELPSTGVECFLPGIESVPEGTEIWWNERD